MTDPRDTRQQRAALRQNRAARLVRERFPTGTRIIVPQSGARGVVQRHVPGMNSQGGHLTVRWDTGHVGRISPIIVQVDAGIWP